MSIEKLETKVKISKNISKQNLQFFTSTTFAPPKFA